jgi:uncharacterized membrane protein YkvA (DUF1232 family)
MPPGFAAETLARRLVLRARAIPGQAPGIGRSAAPSSGEARVPCPSRHKRDYRRAMPAWQWILVGLGLTLALYLLFIGALLLAGRRTDASALATFIPDCLVLFRGLVRDPRVPASRKLLVVALIGYLAMPFDLVPDFVPVAGQLDDAIIVALVLRAVARSGGPELVRHHWPGPQRSLNVILRLAWGRESTDAEFR